MVEITVFGARGSHCVSGSQFNAFGGMTSCVCVRTRSFWILFDAGMGLVDAGKHILATPDGPRKIFIFLSHLHNDHTEGIHFFHPLYAENYEIQLGGFARSKETLLDRVSANFSPPYFPLALSELKSKLDTIRIGEEEVLVFDDDRGLYKVRNVFRDAFKEGSFSVSNWYHPSHPRDGALIFKMRYGDSSIIYATDIELYGAGRDHRVIRICKDAEIAFIDAQYTDTQYFNDRFVVQGYGHSYHSAVLEMARRAGIRRLRFFHHDPSATDETLEGIDKELKQLDPRWACARAGERLTFPVTFQAPSGS